MRVATCFVSALALAASTAQAIDGLATVESPHPVVQTMDSLQNKVEAAGFRVFARIDHAAGASSVGMPLRPTELLIFGNPKGGTALMQGGQTVGIDLPLKYLVWQDEAGVVRIGWNAPDWVVARHEINDRGPLVDKIGGALSRIADEAARP